MERGWITNGNASCFISSCLFGRSAEQKPSLTCWWLSWDNTNMRSSCSSLGACSKLLCLSKPKNKCILFPVPVILFILHLFIYLFHSTCACVEYFGRALEVFLKNVPILCIHGKMKDKRNKIFSEFRELKRCNTRWLTQLCVFFFIRPCFKK